MTHEKLNKIQISVPYWYNDHGHAYLFMCCMWLRLCHNSRLCGHKASDIYYLSLVTSLLIKRIRFRMKES